MNLKTEYWGENVIAEIQNLKKLMSNCNLLLALQYFVLIVYDVS